MKMAMITGIYYSFRGANDMVFNVGGKTKPKEKQQKVYDDLSDITIYDLNQYFEGPKIYNRMTHRFEVRPVIGNESARLLSTLAWFVKRSPVILEGESGSAKSEIQNAIIVLIFGDEGLDGENPSLYFIDTGTDQVQFRKQEDVKITTHGFIPELQNAVNFFDMIKKWCEGKTFKRDVTKGDSFKSYRLPPRPILTCLAINNDKIKELPSEIVRRFIHIWTSVSMNINEKVQRRKGEIRALPDHELPTMDPVRQDMLKTKLISASKEKRRVLNPYAPIIQEYLPKNFTRSNTYVDYFFDIIESITMFYADERHGTHEYIFSSLEDNFLAIEMAGDIFVNMCLGIQDTGRQILDHMNRAGFSAGTLMVDVPDNQLQPVNGYYSVNDIMSLLKDKMGIYRDKTTTEETVRKLVEAGYLRSRSPKKGKDFYYKTDDIDSEAPKFDWPGWDKFADEWMQEHFKNDYEPWKKLNRKTAISVFTGKEVNIYD